MMTQHATRSERRNQVLDAALTCFAEKGYHDTTMDDVVRAANLSKGTLYWYFKSKQELFRNLVETWFTDLTENLGAANASDRAPSEKLKLIVLAIKWSAESRPGLVRALLEFYALALHNEEVRQWVRAVHQQAVLMLEELIRSGVEGGEYRAEVDPGAMARSILAYLDGALLHRALFEGVTESPPALDQLTEILIELLRVRDDGHHTVR